MRGGALNSLSSKVWIESTCFHRDQKLFLQKVLEDLDIYIWKSLVVNSKSRFWGKFLKTSNLKFQHCKSVLLYFPSFCKLRFVGPIAYYLAKKLVQSYWIPTPYFLAKHRSYFSKLKNNFLANLHQMEPNGFIICLEMWLQENVMETFNHASTIKQRCLW